MRFPKYISLIAFSFILLSSCNTAYKFKLTTTKKLVINQEATATLTEANNKPIDSIQFFVNGKRVASEGNTITFSTKELGVGKFAVTALAFYPEKTKKINNSIEVLSNVEPSIYSYKLINTYPHDKTAYTQGLEFHNGFLYETTGKHGKSVLRKVELKTGKVLQEVSLDAKYFGEGMTIFNDEIFWLTWKARKGFVYDLETFNQKSEFSYTWSNEGWGLTNDGTHLIKSDGTHKIWFLDPATQKEMKSIQVYTNKYSLKELNEIEYINGKIYANKWQQNSIVIIDAKTGIVEGVANLSGLKKEIEKIQTLANQDEVLNGIAFDKETGRIFVTGKHWGKLFEIELVKQ
ncbi:glutaminyl-peptide cyclotransferase [Polaribacter gochangensis]|uniref:glutaminyl-peptide cyclotransferase n=1 Tax=Polaribacter gochangensis TaxID=3252903 RepID=UPI003904A71F